MHTRPHTATPTHILSHRNTYTENWLNNVEDNNALNPIMQYLIFIFGLFLIEQSKIKQQPW